MTAIDIPFVDGPLTGSTERHEGDSPPRPGVIAESPIDFGNATRAVDGDVMRFSATMKVWLYVLAEREAEPGWEYRLADPASDFYRQFHAEQQQILGKMVTSTFASIDREVQPVKLDPGQLANEMDLRFGYVTDGELADPRKRWSRPSTPTSS